MEFVNDHTKKITGRFFKTFFYVLVVCVWSCVLLCVCGHVCVVVYVLSCVCCHVCVMCVLSCVCCCVCVLSCVVRGGGKEVWVSGSSPYSSGIGGGGLGHKWIDWVCVSVQLRVWLGWFSLGERQ